MSISARFLVSLLFFRLLGVRAVNKAQTCINSPTKFTVGDVESRPREDWDFLSELSSPSKSKYDCWTLPHKGDRPTDRKDRVIEEFKWETASLMAKTVVSNDGGNLQGNKTEKPLCKHGVKDIVIDEAKICNLREGMKFNGYGKKGQLKTKAGCDEDGNCEDFYRVKMVLTYSCNRQASVKAISVRFAGKMISKCRNYYE